MGWRRMENITSLDRMTNDDVLARVGEGRNLVSMIIKGKNWIGHVLRRDGVLLDVMKARMDGK